MRAEVLRATLLVSLAVTSSAIASDQVDVCAQYVDTGKAYHVTAISTYGTELLGAEPSLCHRHGSDL